MQQSEQINELAQALSLAQSEIEGAVKDAKNPFFKSNYADLTSVIDAIKMPLAKYGLSVSQMTDFDEHIEFVETQIMHKSGQWLRGRLIIKSKDATPQAQGSGLSYSRRYALMAALNVPAVDDDGEAAQQRQPAAPTTKSAPQAPVQQPPSGAEALRIAIASAVKAKKIKAEYMREFIQTNFGEKAMLSTLDEKQLKRTLEHVENHK